jgi:hypothetical protein
MGAALFLQACTAIPVEQRPYKRAELNRVAEETISLMVEQDPALKQALENRSIVSAGLYRDSGRAEALQAG